jgi:hypothetical protein
LSVDVISDLVGVYRGSLPGDVSQTQFGQDIAFVVATTLATVEVEVARLLAGARIGTAVGAFLDAHAHDLGLSRQTDEIDDHLRPRLQRPPQAGTPESIVAAIQLIVGDGEVFIIELPKQSNYHDRRMFFDRGSRMGGGRGVVVALIPASANARTSVMDALRSKISAGKIGFVEEYVDA